MTFFICYLVTTKSLSLITRKSQQIVETYIALYGGEKTLLTTHLKRAE